MKTIEQGWQEIVEMNDGFCCAAHREEARTFYYAGAMNTLAAMTSWNPTRPAEMLMVDVAVIDAIAAELRTEYQAKQLDAAQAQANHAGMKH